MQIVITDQLRNGTVRASQSADGRYKWASTQPGYIQDAEAGRAIYQMAYMRKKEFGSDPLPASVATDVREFWAALNPLVNAGSAAAAQARCENEAAEIEAQERLVTHMDSQMAPEDR